MAIDMWSFGCIMAELFLGYPIFPGEDEYEQLGYIMEVLRVPEPELLKKCSRGKYFFDSQFQPKLVANSRGKIKVPGSKSLKQAMECSDDLFVDFVSKILVWDP